MLSIFMTMRRDRCADVYDIVGGDPWHCGSGQWYDMIDSSISSD
jgi:hypothetical protein